LTTIQGKQAIACELLPYNVPQAPSYTALSYAWGDSAKQQPMLVGERLFYITEALAIALEHLQEEDKTLIIWIDAICINQSDKVEKSAQVQRMGEMYSNATVVLAWLGPADDDTEWVMRAVEQVRTFDLASLKALTKSEVADMNLSHVESFFN
jgi:hypothetical protein